MASSVAAIVGLHAAADEDAESRQETIIVTGEKFDRSLQDTPTSVRVVTVEEMEQQNLVNIYDIIDRTANLTSTYAGTGFTIRGIQNTNVSGTGIGQLATIYLDGTPLPRDAVIGGPLDVWDLSQVEILRGPQSTLQGRNALAGAVVMTTQDPTYDWSGKVRAIVQDKGGDKRFAAAFGGPIIDDQVAFRMAAETSEADGFIYNRSLEKWASRRYSDSYRAKLLVEPDATPDFRAILTYMHDDHRRGERYSLGDYQDSWDERYVDSNRETYELSKSDIFIANLNYDISDVFSLQSISTWSEIYRQRPYDGDYSADDIAFGDYSGTSETFSQEVRLTIDLESFEGVLGAFHSKFENQDYNASAVFSLDLDEDLGLTNTLVNGFGIDPDTAAFIRSTYPQRLFISSLQQYPQKIETSALFGDATWHATDKLKVHAGFRFDFEEQTVSTDNAVSILDPLPNPPDYAQSGDAFVGALFAVNGFIQAEADAASSSSAPNNTEFDAFLPKLGVSYDVAPEKTLSFIVQRGYRSGGSGVNPARASVHAYDQEFTWNYELAWRSLWLNDRLTLNANLFYIDWTDQQVLVYLSDNIYDYETQNAGSSDVRGFEVESWYDFDNGFDVFASLGYAKGQFKEFLVEGGTTEDLSGQDFDYAPKWTASIGGNWHHRDGWVANINANYTSKGPSVVSATTQDKPARTIVNFKAGWENETVGIYLTGQNVFDEEYTDFQIIDGSLIESMLGTPQLFGVTLEAEF
ncbi:MAG: TonB-dependent receptor [Hyphomonas sp.]|nr:TonB-dependent receptor [Hyphomonas sp.]